MSNGKMDRLWCNINAGCVSQDCMDILAYFFTTMQGPHNQKIRAIKIYHCDWDSEWPIFRVLMQPFDEVTHDDGRTHPGVVFLDDGTEDYPALTQISVAPSWFWGAWIYVYRHLCSGDPKRGEKLFKGELPPNPKFVYVNPPTSDDYESSEPQEHFKIPKKSYKTPREEIDPATYKGGYFSYLFARGFHFHHEPKEEDNEPKVECLVMMAGKALIASLIWIIAAMFFDFSTSQFDNMPLDFRGAWRVFYWTWIVIGGSCFSALFPLLAYDDSMKKHSLFFYIFMVGLAPFVIGFIFKPHTFGGYLVWFAQNYLVR